MPAEQAESGAANHVALYGTAGRRGKGGSGLAPRIAICVDDYGLHQGIDRAALALAGQRRLSAISCLVGGPSWDGGCKALQEISGKVEIGLHLNLTEGFAQGSPRRALHGLITAAYARRLDIPALGVDVQRQIDAFERDMGRMPDFIDGHQHVHQLPMVREALVATLDKRYPGPRPWLRVSCPPPHQVGSGLPVSTLWKSSLIGWLGAGALRRLAQAHGYRQNRRLLGVYGLDASEDRYLRLLGSWLQCALDGDLLMCHPSVTGGWRDPLLRSRQGEYRVLSGDAFGALIESAGIRIAPLPEWHGDP